MSIDQARRTPGAHARTSALAGLTLSALFVLVVTTFQSQPAMAAMAQDDAANAVEDAPPAHGFDEKFFDSMEWRCIGPPRGGRATTCTGVIGDPMTYYMGATGGGVWKTDNAGLTWRPVGDEDLNTGSVGAIAVAPSDPNVVYVGMGERCPRGNFSHGDGVYKSVDAGESWTHIGLEDSQQVGAVRVHPDNADLVYVAALGHIHGPNEERGVYRSKDGGDTWEQVLYVDENTGAVDLAMDPVNPRVLYAGFWQVRRSPWNLESGGPNGGLYKSIDGGDTWEQLTEGLPDGVTGKYGVTISPVNHKRVWAIVESDEGGVFRSDDAGENWKRVNSDRSLRQRAWYYTHIYADTQDADTVYVLNVSFHKSTDGGKSFGETIRVPHGDNHDLWINPDNNLNMVNANDGGGNVSFDGGKSWTRQDGQPTSQFYHVTTDNQFPYRVYGAQQDNSTISVSSRASQNRMGDAYSIGGGESGYIAVRPDDPNIVYAGSYGGYLTKYDHRTGMSRNITVWPDNPMGWGADALKYRFQWTFPIVISPHDVNTLYAAGNVIFKSNDEGQSWRPISPDLTTNDKDKQVSSGGPITKDNTSVEYYCTVFALAESTQEPGVLWAGTDDGLMHITRDGGASWTDITPPGLEPFSLISQIDLSTHAPGKAYVAVNRYKLDDQRPYIYRTSDYGRNWQRIDSGIAENAFVRAVREDPKRAGLLYAATEIGVWVSFDDGAHWQSLQLELPATPVTDLVVKDDDLVIGTQGRSFWILDDLGPLRELERKWAINADSYMCSPSVSYRANRDTVDVHYYFKEQPEEPIELTILDREGNVLRTFKGKPEEEDESKKDDESEDEDDDSEDSGDSGGGPTAPMEAGMNKFSWNMRIENAEKVPGAVSWGATGWGPQVVPGEYRVEIAVRFGADVNVTHSAPFTVLADPRLNITPEDYLAQFELLRDLNDAVDETHTAVNSIRSVRKQVSAQSARAKKVGGAEAVIEAGKDLKTKLTALEDELIQSKSKSNQDPLNFPVKLNDKIGAIANVVSRSRGKPTDQCYALFDELKSRLTVHLDALKVVMEEDVPAFNDLVREYDIPAVIVGDEEGGNEDEG